MNLIVQILVGALTGWLTGKAVEVEGRVNVVREGHVLDTIYGIIGALIGEHLFFWIVIGKGSTMSDLLTAILGSITVVGAARLANRPVAPRPILRDEYYSRHPSGRTALLHHGGSNRKQSSPIPPGQSAGHEIVSLARVNHRGFTPQH